MDTRRTEPGERTKGNVSVLYFVCFTLGLSRLVVCSTDTVTIESNCNNSISLSASIIVEVGNWSALPTSPNSSCVLELAAFSKYHVPPTKHVHVDVSVLDTAIPGDWPECQYGRLDIVDSDAKTLVPGPNGLCGEQTNYKQRRLSTSGDKLYLEVFSNDSSANGYFRVLLTSYNLNDCDSSHEFHCQNKHCIDASLRCNGFDNCGDNSDEEDSCWITVTVIAVIVVSAIGLVAISMILAVWAVKKNWNSGWGVGPAMPGCINGETERLIQAN